jgi:hypothetical protein
MDIISLFTTPIGLDQAHNSIPLCNVTIVVPNKGHFFPFTVPVSPNQAVTPPSAMMLRDHLPRNLRTSLHLTTPHSTLKMETACYFKMSVSTRNTPWCYNAENDNQKTLTLPPQ